MRTPIVDFVKKYTNEKGSRFHMPGHKGQAFLGCEGFDITEIAGADALYEAEGIIAKSERSASELFGTARTVFSTEGSSQCIRAMLKLIVGYDMERRCKCIADERQNYTDCAKKGNERPYIVAARNVHKAFLYASALIDFDVVWLYPQEMHSLCSCKISPEQTEAELIRQIEKRGTTPAAVYVTSPDYLGGQLDIAALAEVCHRYHTVLAVDNAHGAYLHFLEEKQHPMDLGADICCDSAHKTLPVLTGGAYLQIGKNAPVYFAKQAKQAMVLFGSTSPSYLILESLDLCNAYLTKDYKKRLSDTCLKLEEIRRSLRKAGWFVECTDPLKLTIRTKKGMTGGMLSEELRQAGIECEYADETYVVLMATPENTEEDFKKLADRMYTIADAEKIKENDSLQKRNPLNVKKTCMGITDGNIEEMQLQPVYCEQKLSVREAVFASQEQIKAVDSLGRICGVPMVSCPPAIPIVVSGELINEESVKMFTYYGIEMVSVVKN